MLQKKRISLLIFFIFIIIFNFCFVIIVLGKDVTIFGKIKSADSSSISNALITFNSIDSSISDTVYSDSNGNYTITFHTDNVNIKNEDFIPTEFKLFQNYPNPFNPGTWISFYLPKPLKIRINVYNILGQKVCNIVNRNFNAGKSKVYWNGVDNNGKIVPASIYFYRLSSPYFSDTGKMLLLDGGTSSSVPNTWFSFTKLPAKSDKINSDTTTLSITCQKNNFHNYLEKKYQILPEDYNVIKKNMIMFPLDSIKIIVTETDVLISYKKRDSREIDNYHHTYIINCDDSLTFEVEAIRPDSLIIETDFVPSFGYENVIPAIVVTEYWDYPEINNTYIEGKPDEMGKSFIWKDLESGFHDIIHVLWSNYYGQDELECFDIKKGKHQYFDYQILFDNSIKKNNTDTTLIDARIKVTIKNTGIDTLYDVRFLLKIPRILRDYSYNNRDYIYLYDLIDDTLYNKIPNSDLFQLYYRNDSRGSDGFWNPAYTSQEIKTQIDSLGANDSLSFIYEMTINPLYNKFEIYPTLLIFFEQPTDNKIWQESIITILDKKIQYSGKINYLRAAGISSPSYILFKIDGDSLGVMSPEETDTSFYLPLFYPDY